MPALAVVAVSAALAGCSLRLFAPEPTPTPTVVPTAVPSGLSVTWATGGKVFVWHDGSATQQIVDTDADAPIFSPDGRTMLSCAIRLAARNRSGPPNWPRQPQAARRCAAHCRGADRVRAAQLGRQGLAVFQHTAGFVADSATQFDLHNVDLSTGTVGQVLKAGLGGVMTFSPNRLHTALVDPGYPGGSVDGSIVLFDAVALGGHIKITFAPAAKGGLQPFDIPIDWQSDSSAFYASTPAWDKVLLPGRDNLRVTSGVQSTTTFPASQVSFRRTFTACRASHLMARGSSTCAAHCRATTANTGTCRGGPRRFLLDRVHERTV